MMNYQIKGCVTLTHPLIKIDNFMATKATKATKKTSFQDTGQNTKPWPKLVDHYRYNYKNKPRNVK